MELKDIKIDYHSNAPIYQQIAEQLRQFIATRQIRPGDRLPSIRQLSQSLNINPNTVCRAYLELEQEQILISRRGGGTSVKSQDIAQDVKSNRQKRLLENMNEDIVKSLSQGYSPMFAPMPEIISNDAFKKIVDGVGGYDTSQTGATTFVS